MILHCSDASEGEKLESGGELFSTLVIVSMTVAILVVIVGIAAGTSKIIEIILALICFQ
jgi:hypothetical protein